MILIICFCESFHPYNLPVSSLLPTAFFPSLTFASSHAIEWAGVQILWRQLTLDTDTERTAFAHLLICSVFRPFPPQLIMKGLLRVWAHTCRVGWYIVTSFLSMFSEDLTQLEVVPVQYSDFWAQVCCHLPCCVSGCGSMPCSSWGVLSSLESSSPFLPGILPRCVTQPWEPSLHACPHFPHTEPSPTVASLLRRWPPPCQIVLSIELLSSATSVCPGE